MAQTIQNLPSHGPSPIVHISSSSIPPPPPPSSRSPVGAHLTTPVARPVPCRVNPVSIASVGDGIEMLKGTSEKRSDYPLAPSESLYAKGNGLTECPRSNLRRSLPWNRLNEQASVRKPSAGHVTHVALGKHDILWSGVGWIPWMGGHWDIRRTIEDIVWLPCCVSLMNRLPLFSSHRNDSSHWRVRRNTTAIQMNPSISEANGFRKSGLCSPAVNRPVGIVRKAIVSTAAQIHATIRRSVPLLNCSVLIRRRSKV
ncbi:hypothetical protein QBC45DRAFT_207735 [Copromyces sp. CBS 386.78]|nr:hypothetical protein QBC45DRAFT_207735 [Copromyces sp. CBS 386.78]